MYGVCTTDVAGTPQLGVEKLATFLLANQLNSIQVPKPNFTFQHVTLTGFLGSGASSHVYRATYIHKGIIDKKVDLRYDK